MSQVRVAVTRFVDRRALFAAGTAAVFLLAACGGSGGAQTDAAGESPAQEAGNDAATVDIVDNAFEPSAVDVAVGGEVQWSNTGDAVHTVTFDDGEGSENLESGATYSRTFGDAGDYGYVCSIHPEMTGTVTVSE